jgi:hypothetical protein
LVVACTCTTVCVSAAGLEKVFATGAAALQVAVRKQVVVAALVGDNLEFDSEQGQLESCATAVSCNTLVIDATCRQHLAEHVTDIAVILLITAIHTNGLLKATLARLGHLARNAASNFLRFSSDSVNLRPNWNEGAMELTKS